MPTSSVPQDDLEGLVADGLRALKGGATQAQKAASDVRDSASHPDLKDALKQGEQTTQQWQDRIERAMSAMGVDGETDNPVIKGVYEVANRTRQEASTDDVRDLGIIASAARAALLDRRVRHPRLVRQGARPERRGRVHEPVRRRRACRRRAAHHAG